MLARKSYNVAMYLHCCTRGVATLVRQSDFRQSDDGDNVALV